MRWQATKSGAAAGVRDRCALMVAWQEAKRAITRAHGGVGIMSARLLQAARPLTMITSGLGAA